MGNTDSSAESDSNGKVNAVTGHRLSDEPVKSTTIMEQNLNPYNVVNQGNVNNNMNNNNNIGYNGQNNNNQFNPNNLTNEQLMQILQTNPYIAQSNPQIQQHLQYLAQLQLAQQHAHNNIQNNQYNKPIIYPQNNNVYNNNPNMYQQQQQQHHAQIHQQIYPQQQQQQQIQQNVPQPNVQPQQQERIPIKFQWTCGGREVFLAYSGDKWSQKYEMYPRNNEFQLILKLRPGIYHYKFIVDNQWRCAPDQKHVKDANGAYSNVLDVQPRNITNVNKRQKQTTNVNNNINDNNTNVSNINQNNNNNNNNQNNVANKKQTIQSSKDKKKKNEWTQMLPHKTYYIDDPPTCPLHLTKVLLNNDTKYDNYVKFADKKEDNNTLLTTSNDNNNENKNDTYSDSDYSDSESSSCLPEPEKVCINHLYVNDKREEEVVTLGITERYKDKYYTTVYYKPIQSRGRIDNSYFIDKSFYAL